VHGIPRLKTGCSLAYYIQNPPKRKIGGFCDSSRKKVDVLRFNVYAMPYRLTPTHLITFLFPREGLV